MRLLSESNGYSRVCLLERLELLVWPLASHVARRPVEVVTLSLSAKADPLPKPSWYHFTTFTEQPTMALTVSAYSY